MRELNKNSIEDTETGKDVDQTHTPSIITPSVRYMYNCAIVYMHMHTCINSGEKIVMYLKARE
jgi:hypothetical protein